MSNPAGTGEGVAQVWARCVCWVCKERLTQLNTPKDAVRYSRLNYSGGGKGKSRAKLTSNSGLFQTLPSTNPATAFRLRHLRARFYPASAAPALVTRQGRTCAARSEPGSPRNASHSAHPHHDTRERRPPRRQPPASASASPGRSRSAAARPALSPGSGRWPRSVPAGETGTAA